MHDVINWLQLLTGLMSLSLALMLWLIRHLLKVEQRITRLETVQQIRRKAAS